jgi:ribonucleoside-diphosphate reductase beta chain
MTAPSSPSLKTTTAGLDRRLVPYRLWEKAKTLGTWDPAAIDFSRDAADWVGLDDREQDLLLRLTAQFEGGEESVTRHLLPLLQRVAVEGRIEEEMFLTSYLWEEAKHVEGFDRCLREIIEADGDLDAYFTAPYRQLVLEELPTAMARLRTDDRPEALARASVTYQMIVEGVLAETGYSAYHTVLSEQGLMPGMQTFIQKVQRDESRHVAYGVFLLSRLVAEHGDPIWAVIEERMDELLPLVLAHIQETLAVYAEPLPFGVTIDQFIEIGSTQFEKRLARIEGARTQSLDEVLYGTAGDAPPESDADRPSRTRPVRPPETRE